MNILTTITICLCLAASYFLILMTPQSQTLQQEFKAWKSHHGKSYSSHQIYTYRLKVFTQNHQKVQQHNSNLTKSYFLELNFYADWTEMEYKVSNLEGLHWGRVSNTNTSACTGGIVDTPHPPEQIDWSEKYVQERIPNEGGCKASWAFVAAGAVEGLAGLKKGSMVKLSEQQLVDCSGAYGNEGCWGGFMNQAFWYMIDHGCGGNSTYPYKGSVGTCMYSPPDALVRFGRCADVPASNYSKLVSATSQQLVSVAIDSGNLMLYGGGIYDGACGVAIDRGMLLVGYGSDAGMGFWKLRNSLGVAWGQKGYLRLQRTQKDDAGKCGIQLAASVPQLIA